MDVSHTDTLGSIRRSNDLITVSLWDGTSFKKIKYTFFEIGLTVVNKVEGKTVKTSDYLSVAVISAFIIGKDFNMGSILISTQRTSPNISSRF